MRVGVGVGVPVLDRGSGMSSPRIGVPTRVFTVVLVAVTAANGGLLWDTGGVCNCLSTGGGV